MSSAFWTRLHVQLSGCVWFGPSEKREFSVLTVHPWDALYRLYRSEYMYSSSLR